MGNRLWFTFFPLWVAVNIVGWLAFNIVFYLPFPAGAGISAGLFLGILQWIVLQKYLRVDAMWIWASIIPYAFVMIAVYMFFSPESSDTFLSCLWLSSIFGLSGFLQSRVLAFYTNHSPVWVVIVVLASLVGMPVATTFANDFSIDPGDDTLALFWFVFGSIYGVITGLTLVLLETVFAKKQESLP